MILIEQKPVAQSPLVEREVEEPQAGAREIRVKVSVCGVCRTDIHIAEGDLDWHKAPIIPGHQIVGRIDQIGAGLTNRKIGERVGIGWLRHVDGTCEFCRRGRENLCRASRYTGYDADGGYAEFAIVPNEFAHALPEQFDDAEVAPLLCGGLIGYRALARANVPENGRLLLVGFGSSAHLVLQIALARGHEVFVVTRSGNHIREARSLSARWAGADFRELPAKMHSAILFAPSGKLVPPTMVALERGGICAIAGIHLSEIPPLDYAQHLFQERELRSVTANTREDARRLLAEAAAAKIRPPVQRYSLGEANRALQEMKASETHGTPVLMLN